MVNAVLVDNNGLKDIVNITLDKHGSVLLKKKQLYCHYENQAENLSIYAFKDIDFVTADNAEVLKFSLPPPLNTHVYPNQIVVCKGASKKLEHLTLDMLSEYCNRFKEDIRNIKSNLTVYDVPLTQSEFDTYESDIGDEDELTCSEEEGEEEDNDDDWDIEEDDVPA